MKRAKDVLKQLTGIMDRSSLPIISCGTKVNAVKMSICSGFFDNVAHREVSNDGSYRTQVEGGIVYIHPGSALFQKQPEWLMYNNLVLTTREYMRDCTVIDPRWLLDVAGNFYKQSDPHYLSKRKKQEKIEPLFNRYEKPDEWRLSKRRRMY